MHEVRFALCLANYNLPPIDRTDMLHQALEVGAMIAAGIVLVVFLLALSNRRKKAPSGQDPLGPAHDSKGASPAPASSDEQARQRAEQDALIEQELRNRAKTRKISEGTDISDSILGSLAKVAETLESNRVKIYSEPYAYEQQVKQCIQTLEGAIRDLRACVVGASSKVVRTAEFQASLERILGALKAEHGAQFDLRVDEEAVAHLSPAQLGGLVQIAHEAAGNALRHGRSKVVSLRLRREGRAALFLVQDNGRGFSPELAASPGKGLPLMRTVAQQIGGSFEITTRLGNGTRVLVTLPDAAA